MLLSAVSVLVVAQSSSEIPEGLMNNPVDSIMHGATIKVMVYCVHDGLYLIITTLCKNSDH